MSPDFELVRLLADGRVHSGPALAHALGIGSGVIRRRVGALSGLGIDVIGVRGRGYRLAAPLDLLDAKRIEGALSRDVRERLGRLEVLPSVDSTNRYLLAAATPATAAPRVCLAEAQTAGRGRHGRPWQSPFGVNLYLSYLHRFAPRRGGLGALSLAVAVAVAEAVAVLGARDIGIKWPNDLQHRGRKLAGILIEGVIGGRGPWPVVAGIGLNVRVPEAQAKQIDQPWADLTGVLGTTPDRNRLAAVVIDSLCRAMESFDRDGFAPFAARYAGRDALDGSAVVIEAPTGRIEGEAAGVDADGALLLNTARGRRSIVAGEVRVRRAAA